MKTVLFYISGHGFGHVVRMAEVIRASGALQPHWRLLARTRAPKDLLPDGIEYSTADVDSGAIESEAGIVIDEEATLDRLKGLLGSWDSLVASEAAFVSDNQVDLIVADIPPIAGDIAHTTGTRCIGISNFTWDWIYEPYAGGYLERLESAYSRMDVLLRLPFSQTERLGRFRRVVDAPLIARAIEAATPKAPGEPVRALLGSRAHVPEEALARAKAEAPEFEFNSPSEWDAFTETLASSDVVIAKLGFSMLADCIAARKRVLYPPRANFREEEILQRQAPQHLAILPIPLHDFHNGNWAPYLRQLAAREPVVSGLPLDGARFCAEFIAGY